MGEDHGPILIANVLAFGIATFWVVVLRIGFRIYKKCTDASDWCLGIALISSICQEVFNAACVTEWGYGQHVADLPPHIAHSPVPLKLYWLNQIFFKLTTLTTKLSLCLVYHHLFHRAESLLVRTSRVINALTGLLVVTYYGAAFLVCIFECDPVDKTWRPHEQGKCIDLVQFRYATAVVNIVTSVLVIATPLPVLFRVRRQKREVGEVIFLILLGLIHTGCTIARLFLMIYPAPDTKSDPQWSNIPSNTVSIIEMDVGIIAASLVVMRPCLHAIYDVLRRRSRFTRLNSDRQASSTGSSSGARVQRDNKIIRTVAIELASQPASREEILPTGVWGEGRR